MTARAFAALSGVLAVLLWPWSWPGALVASSAISAMAAVIAALAYWRGWFVVLAALAGLVWTADRIADHRAHLVTVDERVLVEVTIDTVPAFVGLGRTFDATARLIRAEGQPIVRLRIGWNRGVPDSLRPGDRWQLALQLRTPESVFNPGAVDGLRILWRDHIHARAEVLDSPLNRRLEAGASPLQQRRERIARFLLDRVADPAAGGLLAALAVGYTAEVGRNDWQAYNATGITHLIAISGMHVTLFAALAMAALRVLWGAALPFTGCLRRETFVAVGGIACAFGYALLAGYSVPSQRTALMLAAGLSWRLLARSSSQGSAPAAALLAVLATDPFAVLAAGFWLSFGAVAVILWREATRLKQSTGWRDALRLQVAITFALAPATLASFGSVSLIGLLVNPFAIPLFSFVLVPLVLAVAGLLLVGLPESICAWPLALADPIATVSVALLARVSEWPGGLWFATPRGWWFAPASIACLLLVLPLGRRIRLLGVPALAALACLPPLPAAGEWRALSLDANGVPLVLIETRSHRMVVGTGDRFGTAGARIETLLLPAARERGVERIDLLVTGRVDRDVAAGIGAVQALLPASRVGGRAGSSGELPPGVTDCAGLGAWLWDGVPFAAEAAARGCEVSVGRGEGAYRVGSAPAAAPAVRGATEQWGDATGSRGLERLEPWLGAWRRSAGPATSD
ncbi:MAG: ComEC/Rec2 family competence protein [Steroidobacteraceae bacterium]